jgi:hypothetical protein
VLFRRSVLFNIWMAYGPPMSGSRRTLCDSSCTHKAAEVVLSPWPVHVLAHYTALGAVSSSSNELSKTRMNLVRGGFASQIKLFSGTRNWRTWRGKGVLSQPE